MVSRCVDFTFIFRQLVDADWHSSLMEMKVLCQPKLEFNAMSHEHVATGITCIAVIGALLSFVLALEMVLVLGWILTPEDFKDPPKRHHHNR